MLLFDPSHKVNTMKNMLTNLNEKKIKNPIKMIRKSMKQMKYKQFQIVFIDGVYKDMSEIEVRES